MPAETDESIEYVRCNLCGADDFEILFEAVKKEEIPGAEELSEKYRAGSTEQINEQVVKCRRCGLVYINPRFPQEMIIGGYEMAVDEAYVSQGEARMNTFKRSLGMIEKFAPGKGSILDVGAAAGFFLKVAKDAGWDAKGVEPSDWLAEYGRREFGLDIRSGTLRGAAYPDASFDVVTMWDVLEHTADPAAEVAEVARILKPGGIFVINFPDFGSIWAKLFGRRWWWLLSVHLYYFTPKTLSALLEKEGFETLSVKPHFQRLKLSYLIFRFKVYSSLVYRIGDAVTRFLRMSELEIPYNASQTNIIARKKGA